MTATELKTDSNAPAVWKELVEERQEECIDFRATGYAYPLGDLNLERIGHPSRVWTINVSTFGALVRTFESIESPRLLMELFMPQYSSSLIVADIVCKTKDVTKQLNGKEQVSFLYCLQFQNLLEKEVAFQEGMTFQESYTNEESQTRCLNENSKSLIPMLSGLGLAVVHAALLFCFV